MRWLRNRKLLEIYPNRMGFLSSCQCGGKNGVSSLKLLPALIYRRNPRKRLWIFSGCLDGNHSQSL